MTTDPVVDAAALNYVGGPLHPKFEDTDLIRLSNFDAFKAGVEWRDGHPKEGNA